MSSPSAAKAAKAALVSVCRILWPEPVHVTYGPVGTNEPDDNVEILDVAFTEAEARQSPQRRRWHEFTITGRISTFRGGGEEAQQAASEDALDMLDQLADYLQDAGVSGSTQTSLGGTVEWARLSAFDLAEEEEDIEYGRQAYLEFTVSGRVLA